jgi:hypothetical protein
MPLPALLWRHPIASSSFLIFAYSAVCAGVPQTQDNAAVILALTPRINLPPEAVDLERPKNIRLVPLGPTVRGSYWTDDVGVDDTYGNPYNAYRRSPFGTWSNFDEAKANPYPIPELLVMKNGQLVRDAAAWWGRRRPEIMNDFLTEIYGRIPEDVPRVTWEVTSVNVVGAVKTKTIVGHIDNSAFPAATPSINLTLCLPADAAGPVPVMVVIPPFGGGRNPNRGAASAPGTGNGASRSPPDPSPMQQVLARGWGYAEFNAVGLQPDNAAGVARGIIGLVNKGGPNRPDEWGALTAWAWGLSRSIDYFETDKDVDARRLGVEGHSRWGKTALWGAALDQRWAIVYASCSGEGGAKLLRRNYGETTDNIAGSHWMAGNFRKYGGHWNDLPVDAHELIALVAPRPVFVTGGTQDQQADPHGEFMAEVAAGPAYRLLGGRDLGTSEMPAPNTALISGDIAFREHVGPHTDLPDWPTFLEFASRYFTAHAAKRQG